MDKASEAKKIVIEIGPSDKPYAKLIRLDKRTGPKDRRKLYTYIANDRRNGIVSRRKG
jgi:hypothetical protein